MVRASDLQAWSTTRTRRSGCSKEAGYGPDQPAGDSRSLISPSGLRPDAAAADERVPAAEPRPRSGSRSRLRGGRMEPRSSTFGAPAPRTRASRGAFPPSTTPTSSRTRSPASSAISSATSRHRTARIGVITAIRRWTSCSIRSATPSTRRTDQGPGEGPREVRRRRAVHHDHARREPAGDEPEGEGFRAGAELVPGLFDHHHRRRRGGERRSMTLPPLRVRVPSGARRERWSGADGSESDDSARPIRNRRSPLPTFADARATLFRKGGGRLIFGRCEAKPCFSTS